MTTITSPSTRHFLELRVGKTHTIEVLIHIRQKHSEWFSHHAVRGQLFSLLSSRVVPMEFYSEIERYHHKLNSTLTETKVRTGEGNEERLNVKTTSAKTSGKRKRNPKTVPPVVVPTEKPRRDIRHVFDENLQLTYRLQDLDVTDGVTISVSPAQENHRDGNLSFRQYPKLSKRLVAWCFPPRKQQLDDVGDEDPLDEGFPRPELIPIAGLFQS